MHVHTFCRLPFRGHCDILFRLPVRTGVYVWPSLPSFFFLAKRSRPFYLCLYVTKNLLQQSSYSTSLKVFGTAFRNRQGWDWFRRPCRSQVESQSLMQRFLHRIGGSRRTAEAAGEERRFSVPRSIPCTFLRIHSSNAFSSASETGVRALDLQRTSRIAMRPMKSRFAASLFRKTRAGTS